MIVNWGPHSGESVAESESVHVIHCTACGFKHLVPIPEAERLHELYTHHYHGRDISPAVRKMQEDWEWLKLTYHDRFDLFEQLLPPEEEDCWISVRDSGRSCSVARKGAGRSWAWNLPFRLPNTQAAED